MGEQCVVGGGTRPVARPADDDDLALIERVRGRDLAAFERLYRRYHPRLVRFLLTLVQRSTIVDEVINDVMMVVWDKTDSFRGASKPSTWIFGIAYRKAMSALRGLDEPVADDRTDDRPSLAGAPDHALGEHRRHVLLAEAMRALSPSHRAVVDLTYLHEIGYREIAEILACPVDTVKTRMFHARRQLRRMLSGDAADWL